MDNTPSEPPMDNMGMDDGGTEDNPIAPSADDTDNDTNGSVDGDINDDSSEIMDIVDSLPLDKKAAVAKYAKSMVDDGGDMTDESIRMEYSRIIDEALQDMTDTQVSHRRRKNKIPREYMKFRSPFKSPF